MKKIFKIGAFILMLASAFMIKAKADTYQDYMTNNTDKVDGVYITKKGNGTAYYDYMYIIKRASDNKFVYCIQPGTHINEEAMYNGFISDYEIVGNMSSEQWKRIKTLAYYGYGYVGNGVDHTDKKWYAVTQFLIWQTIPLNYDIYFTDRIQGNRIEIFQDEMAELNALVENHKIKPNFENFKSEMNIGETQVLTDTNNVLSYYDVASSNKNISVSKEGNKLYITAKSNGNSEIKFTKNSNIYKIPPIIYTAPDSQRIMSVGDIDPLYSTFNIKIIGGSVSINKVDSETNLSKGQGDAVLSGAKYNVYKSDGTFVTEMITNSDGFAKTNNILGSGNFYIQESSSSNGYTIDNTKYPFTISEHNLNPNIIVREKVIKRNVEITKVFAQGTSGVMTYEPNVEFDIYLKSNNSLVKTIKTDKDGRARFVLPFGAYIIRQKTTTPNFEKADDFEITINGDSDETIYRTISNREIVGKLKVVKIDNDTRESIAMKGIKFKIFDITRNQYVKQTITYPTAQTIDVFETDQNGILITPYELSQGRYRLEEVDQAIDGYLWNSTNKEFEIGNNSNFIYDKEFGVILEIQFENTEVKGTIEIEKIGEKVVIENGSYFYEEIKLDGVEYTLYADEDIYSSNNKLIYKANDIIGTYVTKDGFFKIDGLRLAKYKLVETKTIGNHVLDKNEYHIELKYKDQYTAVVVESLKLKNYLAKGTLVFSKVDLSDSKPLPNTKIEIYTEDDELIGTYITNEKGEITINDLPVEKNKRYYILEKEAPESYILNEDKMYFEILEDGSIVKATMPNEKIKGVLEFTKIDKETQLPIPNTLIEIYNAENDELIYSGRTDENGKIVIDVNYGKYYILEKECNDYILNGEKMYFEIKENEEKVEAVMTNEKIVYEIPKTEKNDFLYDLIFATGLGFLIYGLGTATYNYMLKKRKEIKNNETRKNKRTK